MEQARIRTNYMGSEKCDDEHDTMTRGSSIGERKWQRHQLMKRQKVTSDTQRDSVPDETPRAIGFLLKQETRPIFKPSKANRRPHLQPKALNRSPGTGDTVYMETTTQYIEDEYVGNAALSASSSSAAVEVVEPQPNRKRSRTRSRPQQRRTRSRRTRSRRTREAEQKLRIASPAEAHPYTYTRSNDEADRSRGSEAPDNHLCKYQSHDAVSYTHLTLPTKA